MNAQPQPSRMGFVLAGGKSSRMGSDKAFLDFGGRMLLEHALSVVSEVCPNIAIVGDAATFSNYGAVVEDIYPGCGPLAGIYTALARSTAELNLVLAVDMPFVSRELLAFLFTVAEKADAAVTVPRTGRGFQPLSAVYRRSFARPAEAALQAGKYKIDALFAEIGVRTIAEDELSAAGFSERNFVNVNTPEELMAARSGSLRT